ncbi:hypothetical protein MPL3356_340062 [Mesorhizobium plurifarium]|uniref:Uncharacterized protein n=1 Tax=Mesorhizobium plurifarium TaxID=69974 RepID=A0A090E265_MESPL|nr:hypothetical protein MPL3356_340062 [Mesorhizobium plurifarium]
MFQKPTCFAMRAVDFGAADILGILMWLLFAPQRYEGIYFGQPPRYFDAFFAIGPYPALVLFCVIYFVWLCTIFVVSLLPCIFSVLVHLRRRR